MATMNRRSRLGVQLNELLLQGEVGEIELAHIVLWLTLYVGFMTSQQQGRCTMCQWSHPDMDVPIPTFHNAADVAAAV